MILFNLDILIRLVDETTGGWRNLWIDTARSRSRKARFGASPEAAETIGVDPRPGMEASVDLKRVMAAMSRLPDEQREVVALILVEGFGYREVARPPCH